tara:strand:+ start:1082 stop:2053 length:972 start_codon:yes stop_codon:yes gene_type:complete
MNIKIDSDHTKLIFDYMRINGKVETLLEFLLRRFRYLDENEWKKNIHKKRLWVNDKLGYANLKLYNNQKIIYLRPDFLEPKVDKNFEVIFEDDSLIGINKSGNLPTSPSGKYFKNTLSNLVKEKFGWEKIYTLHRLDRETSGAIMFAKNVKIAQKMASHFQNRRIKKIYSAILSKHLPNKSKKTFSEAYISLPIGRDIKSKIRIKQSVNYNGKPSQTYFKEIEKIKNYSIVEIRPFTGRTHQIRVHAAFIGCSILGDKLYGLPKDGFINWLNEGDNYLRSKNFPLHRQLLHSLEIRFPHPMTNKDTIIRARENNFMKALNNHF